MSAIISIIVPIYNVDNYLEKCIDSILNQALEEFELVLVNDGSTDNSGAICDKYSNKDERVKVIHKKNGGVSSARNVGIKNANGDYIGFVDPDDYVDIDMYKKLYELCIKSNSDIAICKLGREINGNIINKSYDEGLLELNNLEGMRELFKGELYRFSLCNKLFNKKCFENIKFPEGRIHEDLSTTYKLFANSNKSIYTNYMGYIYVKRENSILTSTYSERRLQSFIGWDEIIDFMSNKYSEVSDQVIATFTYWCIVNINYIFNQIKDKNDIKIHLNYIRQYTVKHYRLIKYNNILSNKYKLRVKLFNINTSILILENRIRCS